MSNIKDVRVGSTEYKIQKMYPIPRSEIFSEIGQIFNGGIEKFKGLDNENLGELLSGVIDRLPPRETAALIKKIITESVISPDMKGNGYNIHFQEFYEDQVALIPEILAFNTKGIIHILKKKFPTIDEFFQVFSWTKTKLTEESSD